MTFDSWFASSGEYDKLLKKKLLNCLKCNSIKIEKNLMAPNFLKNNSKKIFDKKDFKSTQISKKLSEYKKFIKKNFEYVGENFAYEARSVHYGSSKNKKKGIFGTASNDEIKELREEGIEAEMIPWIEDKNN